MAAVDELSAYFSISRDQVELELARISYYRGHYAHAVDDYFIHNGWMEAPLDDFHVAEWERVQEGPDRYAVIFPRGHAKTTNFARIYPCLRIGLGLDRYAAVISYGESNYKNNLNAILDVFIDDRFLAFRDLAKYFIGPKKPKIKDGNKILLNDGGIQCEFRSILGELRGLNSSRAGGRPTLVVLDDILPSDIRTSKNRRDFIIERYFSVIEPMGQMGTKFLVCGTTIHPDDLISKIMRGDVKGYLYTPPERRDAWVDEAAGITLWPARWTAEALRAEQTKYEKIGLGDVFSTEFRNNPKMPDRFPLDGIRSQRYDQRTVLPYMMHRVVCVDHSHGTGNDYFVILENGMDPDGNVFNLQTKRANDWTLQRRVDETIATLNYRLPDIFVIEDSSESRTFIEIIDQELKNRGMAISVTRAKPSDRGDKNSHIYGQLQPRLKKEQILFPADERWGDIFDEEASNFDYEDMNNTDDFLDCFATSLRYLSSPDKMRRGESHLEQVIRKRRARSSGNTAYY